ncbi:MAG: hypothetical protein WDA35_02640 [Bacilli bacterium]
MKNYRKILFALLMSLTLSACTFFPILPSSGGEVSSSESSSSSSESSSSSSESSSSSSESSSSENEDNYRIAKMKYNYQDYMDNNYYHNMDSMPTSGVVNLLVIPVQLTGYPMTETTRTAIQKAYFGTEAETGWHSVASYYHTESNGKLTITGVVSPTYQAPYGTSINQSQTTNLVTTATEWYKTNHSTNNGKEFDADGDGYIDGVVLIYSAPYMPNNNDNLWAYCFWTAKNANKNSPVANTFFWASYNFMYDSNRLTIDAHTYIHELGHVMGLDDYYNYDSNSSYGAAGGFSMQDYNVGEHDPYSRIALGWIDPIVVTGQLTLTINPGQAIILSSNDLVSDSPFDEYLVLDVYSPTGLNQLDATYQYPYSPKGPNAVGIRVWHVNALLMENYNNTGTPTLTTSITPGNRYYHALSNSTDDVYGSMYSGYRAFKLLHLLQAGGTNTYKNGKTLTANDLWTTGKTFSMASYASFFVNPGKLDTNLSLPYSFNVNSINGTNVTLTINK